MKRRQQCSRWPLAATLFATLLLLTAANQTGSGRRPLQRNDREEIEITADNVARLARLVEDADRGTVFLFAEDVELPSFIEVRTNRLTFRGAENNRPIIRCAPGEGAFNVHANLTVVENLVFRGCEQTVVLISDEVAEANPFETQGEDPVQEMPERLDITIRNVDFIGNTGIEDESTAGAFAADRMVHAQVTGCRFERNTGISGGAISFAGDVLTVEDCTFVENDASNTGGAIFAIQDPEEIVEDAITSVSISNCVFTRNRALTGSADRSQLTLRRSIFLETNRYLDFPLPAPSGGAVYVAGFSEVSIDNATFTENNSVPAGGAIYLSDNTENTITSCRFERNFASAPSRASNGQDLQLGGALFAAFVERESSLEIKRCVFLNNNASYGGALHFVAPIDSNFRAERCLFQNNVATLGGGAAVLRNIDAPFIARTDFINNTAFVGGAVMLTNGAGLDMPQAEDMDDPSRFLDNVAYDGGAIFGIGGGDLKLFKVLLERNLAERNGGAVCYIDSKASGSLSMQDARVSRNRAETGGALYLENLSEFTLVAGARDRNHEFLRQRRFDTFNLFERNVAIAGGAIYYRASNLVRNRLLMADARFVDNRAVSNVSLVHEGPLEYPRVGNDARKLLQLSQDDSAEDESDDSGQNLLDPRSNWPCHPGGGAAVCAVLSGIAGRAPVRFEVIHSNFTSNSAVVGGALLIAPEPTVNWQSSCNSDDDGTEAVLTSDPCRALLLRDLRFDRNRAEAAGGAILATNLNDVFYSTVPKDEDDLDFGILREAEIDDRFTGNSVGASGYGKDLAGSAVRLKISKPATNSQTGLLLSNQSSGQSNPLAHIEVEVLDELDQVVRGGIVDSAFPIRAESIRPGTNKSIASGQVVSTAENGVAEFDALALTAAPGEYEVHFSVRGNNIEIASATVELRQCLVGERYINQSFICDRCPVDKFTFYDRVPDCVDCPVHAKCVGGASLVPDRGYWHSSPFSIVMHECFHDGACSYSKRTNRLNAARNDHLEEFFSRFNEETDEFPVFTNEEYQQCADGYEGPLCGSCQDGYGHADGKSCVECGSRSATAAVVFLLAVWQLMFLAVTIRSALVSIRDMNQMMAIHQQQLSVSSPSRRHTVSFMSGISGISQSAIGTPQMQMAAMSGGQHSAHMSEVASGGAPPLQTAAHQHSVEYIIAAQHVSETIKIFVNFFQVTSVAVNINLEWTEAIKNMLATMNSIAGFSNGATFTPMTCMLDSDAERRSIYGVVLRIAFPLCLMVLVMAVFWVQWFIMRRSPNTTRIQCRSFIRSRNIISFLVVGFFAYQSISEDLMGTVSCIELDAKEMSDAERHDDLANEIDFSRFSIARDRYWTEDTSVECYSRSHALLVGFVGIPGIILFLCGVPLYLLIFLLHKRQRGELMELNVLNTYGFIYQNYEDKFVYWEVCILVRKALISAIVVFAYPLGANLQGIMALGVLIIGLAFHLVAAPFKYFPLNVLEACSLVVSIFTFYAGIVFNDENTTDGGEVLLSVLLVVVNALLALVFCMTVYVYTDRYIVAKLKFMGVTAIPSSTFSRMTLLLTILFHNAANVVSTRVGRSMKPRGKARRQARRTNTVTAPVDDRPVTQAATAPLSVVPVDISNDTAVDIDTQTSL